MKKLKKLITILTLQIGVNVIGIPDFHNIVFNHTAYKKQTSKFIK